MREKYLDNIKCCDSNDDEDRPVINFYNLLSKDKKYKYIEIGSGLCRFPIKIKRLFQNFEITCYEINSESAKIAQSNGFNAIIGNILDNNLLDESFDIVHCSHIIEHFHYPDVIRFIDEMFRITKKNGYLIIRTPLMWEHFYDDIDHIRPYPPESIINYLYNPQQQVVGKNKISVESIWYRTSPKQYSYKDNNSFFASNKLFKEIYNRWIHFINNRMLHMWNKYRWPATKPNGYVMILQKRS